MTYRQGWLAAALSAAVLAGGSAYAQSSPPPGRGASQEQARQAESTAMPQMTAAISKPSCQPPRVGAVSGTEPRAASKGMIASMGMTAIS